jgi:hypothetical protein
VKYGTKRETRSLPSGRVLRRFLRRAPFDVRAMCAIFVSALTIKTL